MARSTTSAPVRKISASTTAGALTVLFTWLLKEYAGVEIPPEVASAITTLLSFAAGYWTPPGNWEVRQD